MRFNGKRLGIARKRWLLKRRLAAAIGISEYTILRYEAGKTVPTDDIIASIAKTLRIPRWFFLWG